MAEPQRPGVPDEAAKGRLETADRGPQPPDERLSADPDPLPDTSPSAEPPPGLGEPAEHPDPPVD